MSAEPLSQGLGRCSGAAGVREGGSEDRLAVWLGAQGKQKEALQLCGSTLGWWGLANAAGAGEVVSKPRCLRPMATDRSKLQRPRVHPAGTWERGRERKGTKSVLS